MNYHLIFLTALTTATAAFGKTIPNYAEASLVLGQVDFTSKLKPIPPSAASLNFPSSVIVDPVTRRVFVAEEGNNRILRYASADALANGAAAEVVFGNENFTSIAPSATAAKMNQPYGAWITPDDSLWVADSKNNRLLRFNNASTKPSGAAADGVLGQPDFTSSLAATTRRGMDYPYIRPFVDGTGSLWIAEQNNHRVLRFSPDATPPLLTVTAPAKVTKKLKLRIKGTATDTYGIAKVEYRLGKGPLRLATGTTAWSFKVKLRKGKNTLTILATDVDGIPSLRQIIKITRK